MAKKKPPIDSTTFQKIPSGRSILGTIGSGIADFFTAFDSLKRMAVEDYCPIQGVVNDHTYFLNNTALVTVFEIKGATFLMGAAERTLFISELKDLFTTVLRDQNAAIQMVYQRDRIQVKDKLKGYYAPLLGKAKALRMNADGLINERIERMLPYLSGTEVYIVLYTYPHQLISKEAMKEFRKHQKESRGPDFPWERFDGIQIYSEPDVVEHRHDATARTLEGALKKLRLDNKKLTVSEAITLARRMTFPSETSPHWKPRLPGDAIDPRLHQMDPVGNQGDFLDAIAYPTIGRQFAAAAVQKADALDSVVQVGERFVASQLMELTPTSPKAFEDFLEHIGDIDLPLRVSMVFHGGSEAYAGKISSKKGLSYLAALTSPSHNRKIGAAGETLTSDIEEKGRQPCGFNMIVSTWGDSRRQASERIKKMGRALDAWGDVQSAPEVGDPFLAFTATLPGWANNLRLNLITTVEKMLGSLPFGVVTSPWKEGTLFFKNRQGGIFPYAPLSSEQQTTNILTFAPPGGGKSVLISTLILGAIFDPVLEGLPKIAAIDIGNSSKGVINLLREIAPPELRDRFVHVEFELNERFGINVMDTRVGCTKPTSAERGFLTNFLTLILTPIGGTEPIKDATQIATTLIEELYTVCSEDDPVKYVDGQDKATTIWLRDQRDFEIKKTTTWWQVVNHALSKHAYDVAASAQRYAVPNLKMLPSRLTMSDSLKTLYGSDNPILTDAKRLMLGFIQQYPSLCKPSNFNFQETDVCIIDLNKVTQDSGPEGTRRTSIAYMVSRYLLGKDFLTNKDILNEMPPVAQEFYRSKVASLEVVRKYLIYDEFHRTQGATAVQRTVLDDMRNGRKFNLMVMLASQNFNDFNEEIVKQATVRFVMRVDSQEDATALAEKYGWGETIRQALLKEVRGAGRHGAVMLMHASGLKGDDASCTQVLTNVIGATELAAYATTREDAALRDAILDIGIPYWDAVTLIGRFFPSGVKSIVEDTMRAKRNSIESVSDTVDEEAQIRGALAPMIKQIQDAYMNARLHGQKI